MRTLQALLLALAAGLLAAPMARPQVPPADQLGPDTTAADEQLVQRAKAKVDPASLLEYLRKRTYPEADPKRLEALVRQLGDRSFRVREQAHAELLALGTSSLPALREAQLSPSDEVQRRARSLRATIERRSDPITEAAVARLLAVRKPAGSAEVLLNFLPFGADDSVVEEVCRALPAVAVRGGQPEEAVVAALRDKVPLKRAAAGAALVRAGATPQLPAVRALLRDAEPTVRLRVALALVTERREKDAVEPLIDALGHLPPERLWRAEETLIRIAGSAAPQVSLGTDEAARQKCRKAWADWWAAARDGTDLAKAELGNAFLGHTLVVQRVFTRIVNGKRLRPGVQVQELDAHGKVRWQFDLPTFPVSAEVVGNDRVLVAELQGQRVSERDFKGELKWEKTVNGNPLGAQRLANGNTFVVLPNRLVEYDRKGNEVYHLDRPAFDLFRGRKLRNGEIVFITSSGTLTRIDPRTNKTLVTFPVGSLGSQYGSFEVLPNGNYLVPVGGANQVVEFDPKGKQVWSAAVQWPTSVQRLPNGSTLVGSQIGRQVLVVDRTGRTVWNHKAEGQVFMVQRR
jgi:outer membrane protein assembly factor BamB